MAGRRESTEARVLGPYPNRGGYILVFKDGRGGSATQYFETKSKAEQVKQGLTQQVEAQQGRTLEEGLIAYKEYLTKKGNKPRSIETTFHRLRSFFPDTGLSLRALTAKECSRYYDELAARQTYARRTTATDTHRNTLAEVKTFLRWCVREKYLTQSPIDEVTGFGKRRKGKAQLRITEAKRWLDKAIEYADQGEVGAIMAMEALYLGPRASEIVNHRVRDLDDDGRLLWIDDAKTEAGVRRLVVEEPLRTYLLRLAEGKKPMDLLYGHHYRDFPREWVQRICKAARVPVITAHGMRGSHATIATSAGSTAIMVAAALGHASTKVGNEHYTSLEAQENSRVERVLKVLEGGRK